MVTLEQLKADAKRMAQTSQKNTIEAVTLEQLKEEARAIRQTMPTQTEAGTVANPNWYEEYQAMKAAEANRQAYLDTIKNNMYSPALLQPQSWLEEKQAEQEALQKEIATNSMYSPTLIQPEGWRERRQEQAEENQSRIAAIQAMLPGEAAAGNADTVAQLEAELAQLQQAQTRNEYSAGAALNTLTGAAKQYGAGFVNVLGDIAQMGGASEREEELTRLNAQLQNPDLTAAERAQIQSRVNILNANPGTDNEVRQPQYYEAADRLAAAGALDIEQAKQGQGKLGQTLIDVGSGAAQLGADIAAGALTGGSILLPMAIRSYGGASQEARQNGASYGESVLTGLASAALSALTEKVSGVGVERLTGVTGGLDGIINKGINMAVERFGKSAGGKAALDAVLSALGAGVGEGLEEGAEAILQPLVQRIYDEQALEQYATAEFWADAAYDALVGGLVGAVAGGAEQVGYFGKSREAYEAQQKTAPETEAAESTSVNTDPADHTPAEQAVIDEYQNAVDEGIVQFYEQSKTDQDGKPYYLKPVSGRAANDILATIGKNVSGFKTVFDARQAFHINKDHGPAGTTDHSMADTNDVARIQYILDNYDDIADGGTTDAYWEPKGENRNRQASTVVFSKKVNGTYYVVEAAPITKAKSVNIVSAYMLEPGKTPPGRGGKAKTGQTSQLPDANAPWFTAETDSASDSPVSGPTISQNSPVVKSGETSNNGTLPEGVGAASSGFGSDFNRLQMQTDRFIPEGETPARVVDVPAQDANGRNISRTARTVMEAKQTPDEALPFIEQMVADGRFSYDSIGNQARVDKAKNVIDSKGEIKARDEWVESVKEGKWNADTVALGWMLYNKFVGNGNVEIALDILTLIANNQRTAAQALQAQRILKRLSPEGKLYTLHRTVANLNETLSNTKQAKRKALRAERKGVDATEDTAARGVTLDKELVEAFMKAETDEQRNAILTAIYHDIGSQIPSTFSDKWNAWRYMGMLTNTRTHIRNIVGNAGFAPVRGAKNLLAAGLEKAVIKKGERTKAVLTTQDKALKQLGKADYALIADDLLGGGKWDDQMAANREIEKGRQIFQNKGLEAVRKFNTKALEAEDAIFKKSAYANSLAQYLKANNITAEQWSSGKVDQATMDKARAYALNEAKKATYQDSNAFSDFVTRIARGKNTPAAVKVFTEGVLPFRKTPANILVRGLEYSPVGFIKSLSADAVRVHNGEISAAQMIDNVASGLTGTALMGLGVLLARLGIVTGGESDDEDENTFNDLIGSQNYAVEVFGKSYTLDWLAPEALPFFVGVEIYKACTAEGTPDLKGVLEALENISEPMLEMSMLSSLNDLIDSVAYDGSVWGLLANAAISYISQAVPSIFGALARTIDPTRRSTYIDPDSWIPDDIQYFAQKTAAKVPGLSYILEPYVNAWGEEDTTNAGLAALENFLSPGYGSSVDADETERELKRLSDTGYSGMMPPSHSKSFNIQHEDGTTEKFTMSAEQYTTYRKSWGNTAKSMLDSVMATDAWAGLSDDVRAKVVSDVYSYATAVAKGEVSGYQMQDSWMEDVAGMGVEDAVDYLSTRQAFLAAQDGKDTNSFDELMELWDSFGSDAQTAMLNMSGFEDYKAVADADIDLEWYNEAKSAYNEVKSDRADGEAPQYDLIDQLTDYWLGLDNERKGVMDDVFGTSYSQLGKVLDAAETGMTAAEWYEVKDKYDEIGAQDMTAAQREVAFNHWLESVGWLDSKQTDLMDEQFTYGTYMSANPEKYENLQTYMSETKAHDVYNVVSNLEPANGASTVSPLQKYEAIMSVNGLSETEYQHALSEYAGYSEGDKDKFATARSLGVSMQTIVDAYRWIADYKAENDTTSVSADAVKDMAMRLGTTPDAKGILYAMFAPANTRTRWHGYSPYYFNKWVYAE